MSQPRQEVVDLVGKIDHSMPGPAQTALARRALELVRELDDEELEYQVRLRLINAVFQDTEGGDIDAMLSSFAWCLSRYDADPQRFPADVGYADLLWQYKWMARALTKSPIFPTEQIDAVLGDMEKHYRRAGVGLSGVYMARFQAYASQGRMAEAEKMREAVLATPRDDYSHCDACTPVVIAAYMFDTGRASEGLGLIDQMLASGESCGNEPARALADSLLPLLRAGRLDEARERHLRGYRISRGDRDQLSMIADHVIFNVVTGNTDRALAMTERHLGWLSHDPLNVDSQLRGLRGFALALDAVTAAGHPDTPIKNSDDPRLESLLGEHEGRWSAQELAARAWQLSAELTSQFDARNGNDFASWEQSQTRALTTERYDLPLAHETFTAPVPQVTEPHDGPGWLRRAIDEALVDEPDRATRAMARAEELGELDPDTQAEGWGELSRAWVRTEHPQRAEESVAKRIDVLRANGREVEAATEERLGLSLYPDGTADQIPVLEAELAVIVAHQDPATSPTPALSAASTVRLGLGQAWLGEGLAGDHEDHERTSSAITSAQGLFRQVRADWQTEPRTVWYVDATTALAGVADSPEDQLALADELLALDVTGARRAQALLDRATAYGVLDRNADGAAAADEAAQIYLTLGAHNKAVAALALAADLLEDAGSPEATQRLRYAIHVAELGEVDATRLRFHLGRMLATQGDNEQAADLLTDVSVATAEQGADPVWRGWVLMWLGRAQQGAGEYVGALAAWDQAVALLEEGNDLEGAARGHRFQAQLYVRADRLDPAIHHARLAWQLATRSEDKDPQLVVDSMHLLGNLEAAQDPQAGLTRLRQARDFAEAHLDEGPSWRWEFADITDDESRLLARVGRLDEAVSHQLLAGDLYVAAGDPNSAANAEDHAAGLLSGQGRPGDAVAILNAALGKATDPRLRARILLDLATNLEAVGNHPEAARARADAEKQMA